MYNWFQETGVFIVRHCPYLVTSRQDNPRSCLYRDECNTLTTPVPYRRSVFMDNAALRHHSNTQIIPVAYQTRASENTVGELFSRLNTRLVFKLLNLDTRSGVTYIIASRLNCPCTQQIKEKQFVFIIHD